MIISFSPSMPRLLTGLREVASSYDVILCDIWGVLHDGRSAFNLACQALKAFRQKGGNVVLVTNSPRPRESVFLQLDRLGVPRTAYDVLLTSGDMILELVAERGEAPVHHIGPKRDLSFFTELARQKGLHPPLVGWEEAQYIVCTGLEQDEWETPADYEERLAQAAAAKMDFICANPDIVVHVGNREQYCAGALAQVYEEKGGRVLQIGKPYRPIYEQAFKEAERMRGESLDPKRILAIGDALHTDIKGALEMGLDTLWITSGIHRAELYTGHGFTGEEARIRLPDSGLLVRVLDLYGIHPHMLLSRLVWEC